ncbi:MAG TPA: hypothetical protein VGM87_00330 [Roseomonas sp.]
MSLSRGLAGPPPAHGALRWIAAREGLALWLVAGGAIAAGVAILVQRHVISAVHPLFWDIPVYVAAVNAYRLGLDPYVPAVLHSMGAPTSFFLTSPPTVARLFRLVAEAGLQPVFRSLLVALHLLAFLTLPIALGRLFFGRAPARLALALGAMILLFEAAGTEAFSSGNNGTLLYCAIALAALGGFRQGRWWLFLLAVFVATLFKPFYLAFLAVPALAHGVSWRLAVIGTAVGLAAIGVYVLFAVFDQVNFANWLARLSEQTMGEGLVGRNIYGGLRSLVPAAPQTVLILAQLLYIAALAAAFLLLNPTGRLRWAFLLVAATFANPRISVYDDSFATIPLAFAAATLLPRALPMGVRLAVTVAVLAPLLLVPTYRTVALVPAGLMFPLTSLAILCCASIAQRRRGGRGQDEDLQIMSGARAAS